MRNGSGVQSSPGSSFPAVANTLIESTKFNNIITDINNGITQSISNDGQTPILANLPMGGFKHTGAAAAITSGEYAEYAQMLARRVNYNLLINPGFTVNQRAYISASALASGVYGHDRWKAGAGGGDYSFTQLKSNTQITIAAAKTLIQVVEDKNVQSSSYVLSWVGTAQARYSVNSATPAGAYAASPIIITGQTPGETISVEFNSGTLSNAQLESGGASTNFEYRDYNKELEQCLRYYCQSIYPIAATQDGMWSFTAISATTAWGGRNFLVPMRTAPTVTLYNLAGSPNGASIANTGVNPITTNTVNNPNKLGIQEIKSDGAPWISGQIIICNFTAESEL